MRYERNYDVIAIGAGPAGSMAGRAAAQNGCSALIIEQKLDIGSPVRCGTIIINMPAYEHKLNLKMDPSCINNQFQAIRDYSPSGKIAQRPMMATGVNRNIFDKHLAREAGRAGAHIMINTRVVGLIKEKGFVTGVIARSAGETLKIGAKVVIGADGFSANSARWAGLKKPTLMTHCINIEMVNVKHPDPSVYTIFLSPKFCPGGHAWVLMRGNDTANLGLGFIPKYNKEKISLREMHRRFTQHPVVSKWLEKATPTAMWGGAWPAGGPVQTSVANGLLLAGNSAGHIWAHTGAGVTMAMTAGHIAGEEAARAIKKGDVSSQGLQIYEDKWRATIGKSMIAWAEATPTFLDMVSSEKLIDKAVEEIPDVFSGLISVGRGFNEPAQQWLAAQKSK
ncbi:MAG: NAD(P)/FAD-dependent oxidoreductase [Dehalococcoidia bacterium]|nr:NAD(P)/FAD-dependent oxidoreductase [Dehalococcoidia bacterium]